MRRPSKPLLSCALTLALASTAAATEPAAAPAPTAPAASAQPAAAPAPAPDKVVEAYLKALQDQRFGDAFEYTSTAMRAGLGKEEWSKKQQYIQQMGEVKIFEFKVFPALIAADGRARVPNILKSQDKYLNQLGLDEHELYELVQEGGQWRVDQQTLVDGADKAEYFPEGGEGQ